MCSKRSRAYYWLEDNRRFRHRVCTRTLLHAHHTLSSVRSHFHPFLASVACVASVAHVASVAGVASVASVASVTSVASAANVASVAVRVASAASVASVACVGSVAGVASVADSKRKQLWKLSFLVESCWRK